ncbi:MAG TPA: hypothetical protein VMG35_30590 [Bryobacteraceae bacterium]|nr:hypothetical protein [Bryobacteraceae bacterium]
MPRFCVYRMKDAPRQQFRWAPHVAGAAGVKAKDYQPSGEVQADNEYDAWSRLRASDSPLEVGDLLEDESGQLRIFKYVGFESANWVVPEAKSAPQVPPEQPAQTVQA